MKIKHVKDESKTASSLSPPPTRAELQHSEAEAAKRKRLAFIVHP